jgi:hypothetical protein
MKTMHKYAKYAKICIKNNCANICQPCQFVQARALELYNRSRSRAREKEGVERHCSSQR